jgi:hypothetical protein
MTEQEIGISQLLPGPCCGLYVPGPDEIERTLAELGIERTVHHPEFTQEPEESFEIEGAEFESIVLLRGMENRLDLPSGTPRHFPPYDGATRLWSERSRQQVLRIRRKAPGIVCATYQFHGRTGMPWGIDIFVSQLHHVANDAQKRLGNALVRWLENNWSEMHLNYIIWLNQIKDSRTGGWFSNEPFIHDFGGDPNLVTRRHQDHVHVQIMDPNRGPNQ